MAKTVGFTGTRQGMTPAQKIMVGKLLIMEKPDLVRHGGCHGADTDFHAIARAENIKVVVHPGDATQARAFNNEAWTILAVKPYLERNHDIVDQSDVLIGCVAGTEEERRSGTWATLRYASKQHKHTVIVYPAGTMVRRINPADRPAEESANG